MNLNPKLSIMRGATGGEGVQKTIVSHNASASAGEG